MPWWIRPAGLALGAAAGTAGVLGIPTDVIANPWFERKMPTQSFEVVVLIALSLIAGVIAATYGTPSAADAGLRRTGLASGVVGWFAVSCPLCNPLVVALLGASGASGAFARFQPALGVLAVGLAVAALVLRVRSVRRGTCRIDSTTLTRVSVHR